MDPFGEVKVGVIGAAVGKGKILKGCNDNQRIGPLQKAGNLGGQCGGRGGRGFGRDKQFAPPSAPGVDDKKAMPTSRNTSPTTLDIMCSKLNPKTGGQLETDSVAPQQAISLGNPVARSLAITKCEQDVNSYTTNMHSKAYVERCSNVWVAVAQVFSLAFSVTQVMLAVTKDGWWYEASFVAGPFTYWGLTFGVLLQPRNTSLTHKLILYSQGFQGILLPDLIHVTFIDSSGIRLVIASVRIVLGLGICIFLHSVRSDIASLTNKRLSRFLSDGLLMTVIRTAALLLFFSLDPIRCWSEFPGNLNFCRRTLTGQCALAFMLLVHASFSAVNMIFDEDVEKRHRITLAKVAIGNISPREGVKIAAYAIAACCGFFLFAQYNTRAEISDDEMTVLVTTGAIGVGVLVIEGVWEHVVMTREGARIEGKEREEKEGEQNSQQNPVLKLHWFFQAMGLFACCLNLMCVTLRTVTLDDTYASLQAMMIPFVFLLFILAFLCDSRSRKKMFNILLFLTFTGSGKKCRTMQ